MALQHRAKPEVRDQRDIVIAVMGPTGAGKSSFIKTITGRTDIRIGHGLTSETSKVHEYRLIHKGLTYVLVDTPGFDDTYRDNADVVESVVDWLTLSYKAGTKLKGVLYLHRICDTRMQGSSYANLRMFRKLCGEDALQNVVLATTFWNTVSRHIALQREEELKSNTNFWARMIEKGSKVVRLQEDRESCLRLIEGISGYKSRTLQAQDETAIQGMTTSQTTAVRSSSSILRAESGRLSAERDRALAAFQQALADQASEHRRQLQAAREIAMQEAESVARQLKDAKRHDEKVKQARQLARQALRDREMRLQEQIANSQRVIHKKRSTQNKLLETRRLQQEYFDTYRCRRPPSRRKTCDRCHGWINSQYYRR